MDNLSNRIKLINSLICHLQENSNFETCLVKALDDLKFSNKLKSKFLNDIYKNGFDSLVIDLNKIINERMSKGKPKNFNDLRINEKVRFLIFHRIKIINNLFEKRILLNLMLNKKSLIKINQMLFRISDEIWYNAGDKSTDFNFYSKRFILMNIYTLSFLFNLNDNSQGFIKTQKFIEKQISYVLKFGKLKSKVKNLFQSKTT